MEVHRLFYGMLLRVQRVGIEVGARQGGADRRQVASHQAAFLHKNGGRELVAQRGAVIGVPILS
jgi:hypothetical protein